MSSTEAPPTASRPRTARSAKAAKAAKAPPPTKAIEMLDALKAASRDKAIALDRLCPAPAALPRDQMEAFWMPFTANRQFKANPRMLAKAEGMHYLSLIHISEPTRPY